jgi:DNA-binding LacI/PurR family transcriptional regulator
LTKFEGSDTILRETYHCLQSNRQESAMTSAKHTSSKPSRVTQKDVAERAGVAVSVVSYVLNNAPRPVAAKTRTRVLQAIEELGYRPNEHARRLIQQNWGGSSGSRQFGIIVSDSHGMIERPYYAALISGLLHAATQQQYTPRFILFYDALRNPALFNQLIHPEEISGVVVLHHQSMYESNRELLEKIVARVGNVICLDFGVPTLPSILFDYREAGRAATHHLIGLGHRRIAFLGNRDTRFEGYLDSLRLADIPFDSTLVAGDGGSNSPEDGWNAAREILRLENKPTALFCASDEVASGALCAAAEASLRVPHDLSVVGCDDIDSARFTIPALTTVAVPKAQMASLAIRTMIDRVQHADDLSVNMVFPVELVQRSSTAPPQNQFLGD